MWITIPSKLIAMKTHPKSRPSVDQTDSDTHRSVNVVTGFHEYFVKVRKLSTAKSFVSAAVALEKQALGLWKIRDSLELEDLIVQLGKERLTPDLVAMIMLTGKSILKVKSETSSGGKSSNGKFHALRDELRFDWGNYTGKMSKADFATRRYSTWVTANQKLKARGEQEIELPKPDTPKKWLNGRESAQQRATNSMRQT